MDERRTTYFLDFVLSSEETIDRTDGIDPIEIAQKTDMIRRVPSRRASLLIPGAAVVVVAACRTESSPKSEPRDVDAAPPPREDAGAPVWGPRCRGVPLPADQRHVPPGVCVGLVA